MEIFKAVLLILSGTFFTFISLAPFVSNDVIWGIVLLGIGLFLLFAGVAIIKNKRKKGIRSESASPEVIISKDISPYDNKSDINFQISLPSILSVSGLTKEQKDRIVYILDNYFSDPRTLEKEFIALLLGGKWEWPEFKLWHQKFTELDYFPYMWSAVQYLPSEVTPEAVQTLEIFSTLSLDARRLLVGNYAIVKGKQTTRAVEDIGRVVGMTKSKTLEVIKELQKYDIAKFPLDINENLVILKVNDLKDICEEYKLPKTGKKSEIIERISQSIPEEELKSLLPSEAQRDVAKIGFSLPLRARNNVEWEIEKIRLLVHTVQLSFYRIKDIEQFKKSGLQEFEILGVKEDPCPICSPLNGKIVAIDDIKSLPPFHPGCRCTAIAHFDF